ncbi:MAG: hypothetical protein ACTSRW_04690 [Candidatus Helarchaeota archaeon]
MKKNRLFTILFLAILGFPLLFTIPSLVGMVSPPITYEIPAERSGTSFTAPEVINSVPESDVSLSSKSGSYQETGYTGSGGTYDYKEDVTEILYSAGTEYNIPYGITSLNIPSGYPSLHGTSWSINLDDPGLTEDFSGAFYFPGRGVGSAGWSWHTNDPGNDISNGYAGYQGDQIPSGETEHGARFWFQGYASTTTTDEINDPTADQTVTTGHTWSATDSSSGDFGGTAYHNVDFSGDRLRIIGQTQGGHTSGWGGGDWSRTGTLAGNFRLTFDIGTDVSNLQGVNFNFDHNLANIDEGGNAYNCLIYASLDHLRSGASTGNVRYIRWYKADGWTWVGSTAPTTSEDISPSNEGTYDKAFTSQMLTWLKDDCGVQQDDQVRITFYYSVALNSGDGTGAYSRFESYLDNFHMSFTVGTIRKFSTGTELGLEYQSLAWNGRYPLSVNLTLKYWKGTNWVARGLDSHVDFVIEMSGTEIVRDRLNTYTTTDDWVQKTYTITSRLSTSVNTATFRFYIETIDNWGPNVGSGTEYFNFYLQDISFDFSATTKASIIDLRMLDYTGGSLIRNVSVNDGGGWGGMATDNNGGAGWAPGANFDLRWQIRDPSCHYTDWEGTEHKTSVTIAHTNPTNGPLKMVETHTETNGVSVTFEVLDGASTSWELKFTSQIKDDTRVASGTAKLTIQNVPADWGSLTISPTSNGETIQDLGTSFEVSNVKSNTAYTVTATSNNLLTNAEFFVEGVNSLVAWPGNSTEVKFRLGAGITATGQVNATIINSTDQIVSENQDSGPFSSGIDYSILNWTLDDRVQPDDMVLEVSAFNDGTQITAVGLRTINIAIKRNTTVSSVVYEQPYSKYPNGTYYAGTSLRTFVDGDTLFMRVNWTDDHLTAGGPNATVAPIVSLTINGTDENGAAARETWVYGVNTTGPLGEKLISFASTGEITVEFNTNKTGQPFHPLNLWSGMDVGDYDFTLNLSSRNTYLNENFRSMLIQGNFTVILDTQLSFVTPILQDQPQGRWLYDVTVSIRDVSHGLADVNNGSGDFQGLVRGSWSIHPDNRTDWIDGDGVHGGGDVNPSAIESGSISWSQLDRYLLDNFQIPQKAVPYDGDYYFINVTFWFLPQTTLGWTIQNITTTEIDDGLDNPPYHMEIMLKVDVDDNPSVIFPRIHMVPDSLGGQSNPIIWYNATKDWVLLFAHFGNETDPTLNGFVNSTYYRDTFPNRFTGTANATDGDTGDKANVTVFSDNWPYGSSERYYWKELIPILDDGMTNGSLPDYHPEAYPYSDYYVPDFDNLDQFTLFSIDNNKTWGWYWLNLTISTASPGRQTLWTRFHRDGYNPDDPTKSYDPVISIITIDITPNQMKFSYWEDNPFGYLINPAIPGGNHDTYWYGDVLNFSWKVWDGDNGNEATQDSWLLKGANVEVDIDPNVDPIVLQEVPNNKSETIVVTENDSVLVSDTVIAVEGVYNNSVVNGTFNYYNESLGSTFLEKNITLAYQLPSDVLSVIVNYSSGTGYYTIEINTTEKGMNAGTYSFTRSATLTNYSATQFATGLDIDARWTQLKEQKVVGTITDVDNINSFRTIYEWNDFSWYNLESDIQILLVQGQFSLNWSYNESTLIPTARRLGTVSDPNVTVTIQRGTFEPFYNESVTPDSEGIYCFTLNSSEYSIMTDEITGINNEYIIKVYAQAENYQSHTKEFRLKIRKRPAALLPIDSIAELPIQYRPVYTTPQGGIWRIVVKVIDPTDNDKLLTYADTQIMLRAELFGRFSTLSQHHTSIISRMSEIPGQPGYFYVEYDTWEQYFVWWDSGPYHLNIIIDNINSTYESEQYTISKLTYETGSEIRLNLDPLGVFGPLTIPFVYGIITGVLLGSIYSAYVGIKTLRTPYALRMIARTQKEIKRNKKTHAGIMKSREQQVVEEAETKLEIFGIKLEPLAAKKLPPPILKKIKKEVKIDLPALKDDEIKKELASIPDLSVEEQELFFKEIKGLSPHDQRIFIKGLKGEEKTEEDKPKTP